MYCEEITVQNPNTVSSLDFSFLNRWKRCMDSDSIASLAQLLENSSIMNIFLFGALKQNISCVRFH